MEDALLKTLRHLTVRLTPIAANLIVIAAVILFYRSDFIPAFSFVSDRTLGILALGGIVYGTGALLSALTRDSAPRPSKGQLLFSYLGKVLQGKFSRTSPEERLASLIILVKAYFLPIMVNFAVENLMGIWFNSQHIFPLTNPALLVPLVSLGISILFFIDVAYFTFGYTVEHPALGNTFRSVDATISGWLVTLLCYPPFNSTTVDILGWYASDNRLLSFANPLIAWGAGSITLVLFAWYLWATIALGAKCSNLTNRGIVSSGPYAFIRHPAYVAKNAVWILSVIPLFSLIAYASVLGWALIYVLRALTEERHLKKDPEYRAYMQKVRWRFVPYVW